MLANEHDSNPSAMPSSIEAHAEVLRQGAPTQAGLTTTTTTNITPTTTNTTVTITNLSASSASPSVVTITITYRHDGTDSGYRHHHNQPCRICNSHLFCYPSSLLPPLLLYLWSLPALPPSSFTYSWHHPHSHGSTALHQTTAPGC